MKNYSLILTIKESILIEKYCFLKFNDNHEIKMLNFDYFYKFYFDLKHFLLLFFPVIDVF